MIEKNKEELEKQPKESLEKKHDGYHEEIIGKQQEYKDLSKEKFEKKLIKEKLEEELEKMEMDPKNFKDDIKKEKEEIRGLEKEGMLSRLLKIAQEKGPAFAVAVAKDMKDPYLLDVLHDILIEKGFYKDFLKSKK